MSNINRNYADFERNLPRYVAKEALDFVHSNFNKEGLEETRGSWTKWKDRSPVTNEIYDNQRSLHGLSGSVFSSSNPILKQTGALYKSIKTLITGKNIFVGSNLNLAPYAKLMNEGGRVRFGIKFVTIPARPFLKFTTGLDTRIKNMIIRRRAEILRLFTP
jgi:phage gpG-like protein